MKKILTLCLVLLLALTTTAFAFGETTIVDKGLKNGNAPNIDGMRDLQLQKMLIVFWKVKLTD